MPPLVIARNQASGRNLVESTKLERIIIDSKTAHRKEKKEKKDEKRKHKKEKHEKSKSRKHSSRKGHDDQHHKEQLLSSKKISDESDQLEKSGLTEELEGPQNQLGYLSDDGSQNSKKRKRDDSPPAIESHIKAAPVAGNPLRIRLIFKKPKAEEVPTLPREELSCSTSVAKSLHTVKVSQEVLTSLKISEPVVTSSKVSEPVVTSSNVSEPEENLPSTSGATIVETKKTKKHKPSKEDRYNALFDDWTPTSICFSAMEVDSSSKDDDDWLFGSKTQEKLNYTKAAVKIDEDMNTSLQRRGDSSWPRAQFLSEVGIYSLPYTVPL